MRTAGREKIRPGRKRFVRTSPHIWSQGRNEPSSGLMWDVARPTGPLSLALVLWCRAMAASSRKAGQTGARPPLLRAAVSFAALLYPAVEQSATDEREDTQYCYEQDQSQACHPSIACRKAHGGSPVCAPRYCAGLSRVPPYRLSRPRSGTAYALRH